MNPITESELRRFADAAPAEWGAEVEPYENGFVLSMCPDEESCGYLTICRGGCITPVYFQGWALQWLAERDGYTEVHLNKGFWEAICWIDGETFTGTGDSLHEAAFRAVLAVLEAEKEAQSQ